MGPSRARLGTLLLALLGIVILVLLVRRMDLELVVSGMKEIGAGPILLSMAAIHLGYVFYTLGWYVLLEGELSFVNAYLMIWAGVFMHYVIPTGPVSMDATRIYFAKKGSRLTLPKIAFSVATHRISMLFPFLVYIGASFLAMTGMGVASGSSKGLLFALAASSLVLLGLIVSFSRRALMKVIDVIGRLLRRDMGEERRMADEYIRSFATLKQNKKMLLKTSACSFASWFFDVAPVFILFRALGLEISIILGILIHSINIIMLRLPIGIPANIGVREWASVELLEAFGVAKETAFIITLVAVDVVVLLNQLLVGLIAYLLLLRKA